MKLNYSKQCLLASAIQVVALVVIISLLIFSPVYAEGEGAATGAPALWHPTDAPTESATDAPTEAPTEVPTEVPTEEPTEAPTEAPTEPAIKLSAVVNVDNLNIREAARSSSRRVGRYIRGTLIEITEQKTISGVKWGRTSKGWVCLSYVKIGATQADPPRPVTPPVTELTTPPTAPLATEPTTPPVTEPPAPPTTEPPAPPAGGNSSAMARNPFSKSDFVKDGHFISCEKEKTAIGIDVSTWQGDNVDWKKLKAAGIDYVMIRAGFRGTGWEGSLNKDNRVDAYYAGAKAAGLKIGFYFYSQARTVAEAQEEAKLLMEIVKDFDVDLPLVCDWEYANKSVNPRVHGMTKRQITDCIKAFCKTVKAGGYYAMAYMNNYVYNSKVYIEEFAEYGIWYADYRNYLNAPYRVDMWQYTDKGKVSGIPGNVDLNVIFLENSIFAEIFD